MTSDGDVECLVVGMLQGNCYLVRCGNAGESVIIDPGDEPDKIEARIREMALKPEAILLTHGHIDHINAASRLREVFGCRVVCHASDTGMVQGEEPTLWGLVRNPCHVDQQVEDGDTIVSGDKTFKVIHTPGHTRGSVCFLMDSNLFSGDVLFMGSIGRTDLPGGSDSEMMKTLKTKIAVLGDDTRVYPGHGPDTTIGNEKRSNPFLSSGPWLA
jgi:glyoxylase-like metal-dependent hydrolase (beta-lactamase superfamily II)